MSYDAQLAEVRECDRLYVLAKRTGDDDDWRRYVRQVMRTARLLNQPMMLWERPERKATA